MLKKQIGALFLAATMLCTTNNVLSQGPLYLEAHAVSAAGTLADNISWNVSGSTLTISGSGKMEDYKSSSSQPWRSSSSAITTIKVSDGITYIGKNSFSQLPVTSVSLPSSLTEIGIYAFSDCTALKSIKLPSKLTKLGNYAFSDCTALNGVKLPDGLSSIGKSAFARASSLTEITIPGTITSLPDTVFLQCSSLSALTIPPSVVTFGVNICSNCSSALVIYGEAGSAAEQYAKDFGYRFSSKHIEPVVTTTTTTTLYIPPDAKLAKGDVNGDSAVDSNDAVLILREYAHQLLGEAYFVESQRKAGDVNENGKVDTNDARLVLRYFASVLLGETPSWS